MPIVSTLVKPDVKEYNRLLKKLSSLTKKFQQINIYCLPDRGMKVVNRVGPVGSLIEELAWSLYNPCRVRYICILEEGTLIDVSYHPSPVTTNWAYASYSELHKISGKDKIIDCACDDSRIDYDCYEKFRTLKISVLGEICNSLERLLEESKY